jgi:hypothetical protein
MVMHSRGGISPAIGQETGTQQEEVLMIATLIISENIALAARSQVERMTGIEPALSAWEFAESARIGHAEQQ